MRFREYQAGEFKGIRLSIAAMGAFSEPMPSAV
jgi:hypothetical protein